MLAVIFFVPSLVIGGSFVTHVPWVAAHAPPFTFRGEDGGWWCPRVAACLRMPSLNLAHEPDLVLQLLFLSELCHWPMLPFIYLKLQKISLIFILCS